MPSPRRARAIEKSLKARDIHVYWARRIRAGGDVALKNGKVLTMAEAVELVGTAEHHDEWTEHYTEVLAELGYVQTRERAPQP